MNMKGGEPTSPRGAPHVALLSSPGMGHVAPVAELARRLHAEHGLTCTILTFASSDTPAQRAYLATLPPPITTLTLPSVPLTDLLPSAGVAAIETLLSVEAQRSVPAITSTLRRLKSTTRLVAYVADLFGADTLQAARDAGGVPGFLFFPSNLLMLSLMLHLPRLHAALPAGLEFRDLPDPVTLPGCVPVPGADLLQPLQDRASDAYRWMLHHAGKYRDAKGILVNTFDAAEPGAAAVFRDDEPWRPPVYPVGPVTRQTGNDGDDATGCVAWLDAQPDGSVLFVSLGSGGALPLAQTRELARGLEASGHRFLWVVRSPPPTPSADDQVDNNSSNPGESYYDGGGSRNGDDDPLRFLPPGFVDRTKEVGYVVPSWAPQARVLAHRTTGAMLTHCGWNSVLESVARGVPMVAWPLYAEQRQNAVMLCEETRVALRPKVRGDGGGMVLAQDVAEVVEEVMRGEKGERARARVAELQETARKGLQPGGASYETLAHVVSIWRKD
ncbi:hypothetical protein QOZ80_2AG0101500 [Eleusine coracana subsp. coracana]|nr:hypothetical protein QOZ80_2AG0101500 [Eleusine coracana subsp. coracana]